MNKWKYLAFKMIQIFAFFRSSDFNTETNNRHTSAQKFLLTSWVRGLAVLLCPASLVVCHVVNEDVLDTYFLLFHFTRNNSERA